MEKARKLPGIKNTREQNDKVLESALLNYKRTDSGAPSYAEMRESIKRATGKDIADHDQFPVLDPRFSFAKLTKMREANAATSNLPLLRAGVQTIVNNAYQTVETSHEKWVQVVQSDKEEELYAPLHGLSFPSEVGRQEKYPESTIAGLDIKLRNRKIGEIFPVEKELLMNDQTGQVQQQIKLMSEYAKQVAEVIVYGKLNSISGQKYANLKVPVSETKPSTESSYPWSAALVGGGATKGTAAAFAQQALQDARVALMKQKNLLGLYMAVNPSGLLISPQLEKDASIILNSQWYPSAAGTSGSTGGPFANNFMKGLLEPIVSRFMFDNSGVISGVSKAWYVFDQSKPAFVLQMRTPAEVTQEDPNSGQSFDLDVIRWKLSIQLNADFIDPRFFYQGSDGSV